MSETGDSACWDESIQLGDYLTVTVVADEVTGKRRFIAYAEGDKDSSEDTEPLHLTPDQLPPGSTILVRTPQCTRCLCHRNECQCDDMDFDAWEAANGALR